MESRPTGLTLSGSFQLQEQGCPGAKHKGPRFRVCRLQVEHVTLAILLTEKLRIKNKTEINLLGLANRAHVDTQDREHLYVLVSSGDLPPVWRTHTHSAKTHSLSNPVLPLAAPQTKITSVPGFGGRKDKKCKVPSSLPLFLVGATGTSNCGTAGLPKWTHLLPTAKLKDGFEKGLERWLSS